MFLKAYNEKQKFNFKAQIKNAWNLDFHGVKMGVTHFVTQFAYVSKHFEVYSRTKKLFKENCFQVWSRIWEKKWFMCPQNYF